MDLNASCMLDGHRFQA